MLKDLKSKLFQIAQLVLAILVVLNFAFSTSTVKASVSTDSDLCGTGFMTADQKYNIKTKCVPTTGPISTNNIAMSGYETAFFYAVQGPDALTPGGSAPTITFYAANSLGLQIVDEDYPGIIQTIFSDILLSKSTISRLNTEGGSKALEYNKQYKFTLVAPGETNPIGTYNITLHQSSNNIDVEVTAPTEAIYGHRPLDVTVRITNNMAIPYDFDGSVTTSGYGWNGELTEVYMDYGSAWFYGIDRTISLSWKGHLEPGKTATLSFRSFTDVILGTFPYLQVSMAGRFITQDLTVTKGTDPASGKIWFNPSSDLLPGEYYELWIQTTSPETTQFIMQEMTSSCGVKGLPVWYTGNDRRTWEQHNYYGIQMPENYAGDCIIRAKIMMWNTGETFDIEHTFYIGKKNLVYLPFVAH